MELGNLSFSTLTPLKNYDPHTQSGLFLTWFSNVVIRNLWKDLNWNHDSGLMQTLMLTKSILLSAQRVGDAVSTAAVIRQRFAGPIKSGKLFQSMKVMHMIQVTNTLGEYPSFLRHKRQGAFLTQPTHPSPSLPFPPPPFRHNLSRQPTTYRHLISVLFMPCACQTRESVDLLFVD